ncbi:GumC family protein [Marinoscillum pacificum]|uniref:GumC family protein n=1 Tax=Marinoscillum pacificum TaxID=392723 RepID=UPI0021573639|nr:hypothetical protein [Marinoscillum pacificum]
MSLFDFIRLLYRNALMVILVPLVLAITVFHFTRNQDKEYAASAMIYTGIASGFNIESGADQKLDYKAVNNAFDNLLLVIESRITLEEVSLRLIASHLILEKPTYGIIEAKAFTDIHTYFSDDLKSKVVGKDEEETYQRLKALYELGNPELQQLVNKGKSHWSLKRLSEISAKRNKSSDMVELAYKSTDPGICQQTLVILLDVFTRRYKDLKQSETGDVVAYFEAELQKGKNNLNDAEDRLTQFRVKSRVINYVEQTKAIAFKKQNALEEFAMKKMNLKSTEAALRQIEEKLKIRENILGKNVEVLEKKNRLTAITGQLALLQAKNGEDSVFQDLITEQNQLKNELERDLEILFSYSNTKEGLPSRQLLNDWLNNVVQLEKDKVIVSLYQTRLNDLDKEYDRFAPMGSTIARLEREIDVYEREYLEILHGLNMAKLRQQHIEMSSNVEILDEPKFPQEALASKRGLLIIASFMFGLFSVVASLLGGVLLDSSLKNPVKANKITGLEVAGVLPKIDARFEKKYDGMVPRLSSILANKIKLEKHAQNLKEPILIVGLSTQQQEGKTTALLPLFQAVKASGETACLITPKSDKPIDDSDYFEYIVTPNLSSFKTLSDFTDQEVKGYDYIFLELPAWVEGHVPVQIVSDSNLILWTVRADRSWSVAYKSMLSDLEKLSANKPQLILNGIKHYYLDQVIAELPVKRSLLVNWIRKVVRFELGNSGIKSKTL